MDAQALSLRILADERGERRREHMRGEGEELARAGHEGRRVEGRHRAALELDHQVAVAARHDLVARPLPDLLDLGEVGGHADLELLQVVGVDDGGLGEEIDPAGERPQHRLEAPLFDDLLEGGLHPSKTR